MHTQKTKTFSGQNLLHSAIAVAMLLTLGACREEAQPDSEPPPTQSLSSKLVAVSTCQDLGSHIVAATTEQILRDRYEYGGRFLEDAPAAGNDSNSGGMEPAPTDYTTTNTQEQGVDEADFVKTDGEYIYTLSGSDVVIVDSWPAEQSHEVGRFTLADERDSWPAGMFLKDDTLVTFSYVYDYSYDAQGNYQEGFSGTRLTVLDVSDRANPVLQRRVDLEGWYNDGRMIDGDVYLVTNSNIKLPNALRQLAYDENNGLPAQEWEADEARRTELKNQARPLVKARVQAELNGKSITDMLPRKRVYDALGAPIYEGPVYSCTDLYLPAQVADLGVLNITHLDLNSPTAITSTGLLANGWQVYASQQNLYVSMNDGGWWWGWGDRQNETHIHKFDLSAPNGKPRYAASGKVDGWLLNQFSMSEYQGHLRVATTDNEWVWDEATQSGSTQGGNHLTILKEDQGNLVKTGEIRDLAPGERIYSARMMGNKGYVVTFQQTDPLFTFDLSNPAAPVLQGELKVNGFSSYIHPMGPNHLLTIGQDADDQGLVSGVHLQIFDVSDMAHPTRTFQHKISTGQWSSWSEAMWDHHAFTYHPGKEILAVPMNIHEWDQFGGENFSGLMLFKASKTTGFSELGKIDHSDMTRDFYCAIYPNESWACDPNAQGYIWWTSVRRSTFIEDYAYSISDIGMKVNDLLTPENEHAAITLRTAAQGR